MSDTRGLALPVSRQDLSRRYLFVGLAVIGLANGLVTRMVENIMEAGWVSAVMNTFEISAIAWIAVYMVPGQILKAPDTSTSTTDFAVAVLCLVAFLIPVSQVSWIALTALAAYMAISSPRSFATRGAAALLFAITLPMFWARLLLSAFSGPVLRFDAAIVATLAGTTRVENAVSYIDRSGTLWIAPTCSSLSNTALAVLCWVVFMVGYDRAWTRNAIAWGVLAAVAVAAMNIVRLVLLVLYPDQYSLLHGPIGNTTANWLTAALLVGICWLGVRHGRSADT